METIENRGPEEIPEKVPEEIVSRRQFLKKAGATTSSILIAGMGGKELSAKEYIGESKENKERLITRTFHDFLSGACATPMGEGVFAVDLGDMKHCYKVLPGDLDDLEKIRKSYEAYVKKIEKKKVFKKNDFLTEAKRKAGLEIARRVRICEDMPEDGIPEGIKKYRQDKAERIKKYADSARRIKEEKDRLDKLFDEK